MASSECRNSKRTLLPSHREPPNLSRAPAAGQMTWCPRAAAWERREPGMHLLEGRLHHLGGAWQGVEQCPALPPPLWGIMVVSRCEPRQRSVAGP
jgi:hypothetical protein